MEKNHVFIAGAGPVGLAAAVELTRRDIPVTIIDPDLSVSPQSRALAVNARTLDLLKPSGVTDRLLVDGQRIRRALIRNGTKTLGTIDMSLAPQPYNFLLVVPQSHTEEVLEHELARMGVKVERGLSLTSFHQTPKGVNVTLSDGSMRFTPLLLGADGARSTVRKTLGFGFPGESEIQSFGLCDVALENWPYDWNTVVLTIMPGYVVGFIPMGEGHGRFVTTKPDPMKLLPPDAKVTRTMWVTDFNINYRQVESYQKDNVYLAGDAAHIHSPVGGRGMNLGIEDACWFAWLCAENRLQEFTKLRHPVAARVLSSTNTLTNSIATKGWTSRFFFAVVLPLVLHFPAVQRRALRNLTAQDTPPAPWLS